MSAFDDLTSVLDGFDLSTLFDESPNASLTYFNVTSASNIPLRKPIPIPKQQTLIEKHYHPEKSGDIAYFYGSLPEGEIWRLLVDLKKQQNPNEQGYKGYERREKGSIQCLLDAFKYVCETVNEPLTPDYIRNIHRIAAKSCPPILGGLNGWSGPSYTDIRAGEFKTHNSGTITMSSSCITPLGLIEMKRDFGHCSADGTYVGIKPIKGDYGSEVLKLITTLEESLESSNPFAKLKAIVLFTQQLERLHAFADGNTRTCITLLMNRELVRQGFTPTILKDPNRFDGFAFDEMVFEVLRGMEYFEGFKNTGTLPKCASVPAPGK